MPHADACWLSVAKGNTKGCGHAVLGRTLEGQSSFRAIRIDAPRPGVNGNHGCWRPPHSLSGPGERGGRRKSVRANEPIFNVPGAVIGVIALLAAVHAARSFLAPYDDAWLVYALAIVPARYTEGGGEWPGGTTAEYTSFVTHMLVHGDLFHLAINSAWLLAFGGAIAERVGSLRFLAFSLFTGVAGAITFILINPGLEAPVIGASGAVAGLMGGTMRFMFSAMDDGGFHQLREAPRTVRLMPLGEALADRRVLAVSALFILLNVLAIFGFGGAQSPGGIAWEAHLGGYIAGLLAFGLFDAPPMTSPQPREY
jgi:membrane associated rhomboid family serine protease